MPQSSVILFYLIAGFVVYIVSKGELATYVSFLTGTAAHASGTATALSGASLTGGAQGTPGDQGVPGLQIPTGGAGQTPTPFSSWLGSFGGGNSVPALGDTGGWDAF